MEGPFERSSANAKVMDDENAWSNQMYKSLDDAILAHNKWAKVISYTIVFLLAILIIGVVFKLF